MHLIGLAFQKQQLTYLPTSPLYGEIMVEDLPLSYHQLLTQQNGGYTSKSYYPTSAPTSDSLSAVYIPYLAGLLPQAVRKDYLIPSLAFQDQFKHRDSLPKSSLIIYEDGDRIVFLDYDPHDKRERDQRGLAKTPSVRYRDLETDQWMDLAPNFDYFIQHFESRGFALPAPPMRTYHRANAAFIAVQRPEQLARLFEEFQGQADKTWYFHWIRHFLQSQDSRLATVAKEALDFQTDYFRPLLSKGFEDLLGKES